MPYHRGAELEDLYRAARSGGYGFFASNVTELNILVGLLNGAARAGSDLVVQLHRSTCAFVGNGNEVAGLRIAGAVLDALAADREVGVFLNVDHLTPDDRDFLDACVESGIPSSVMIDASPLPFEENVDRSREVVDLIEDRGADVLVEAELGTVAGEEAGVETTEALYTDPRDAVEFVDRTGCDLLAVSIGTAHGVTKGRELDLRPSLAQEIDDALRDHGFDVPLVLHGSSGLYPEQVRSVIDAGVCKLNTNTRYQYEFSRTAFDHFRANAGAILPPDGVADDRAGFFSAADWAPEKDRFNPQVVMERVRERIADVMADLAELTGSAGESRYA